MNLLGSEQLYIGIVKSKYEESLDRIERMNRINTAGLELFYQLHFSTLKHANTSGTAKYAKYAKKIRMQRNTNSCYAENDGLKSASGIEKPAFAG